MMDSESSGDESPFYFESDHVALRGHPDYTKLLRTIVLLESQKVRAHKVLQDIRILRDKYLENPDLALEKLRKNEGLIPSHSLAVAELPALGIKVKLPKASDTIKQELTDEAESVNAGASLVRGRMTDVTKPETFNQLWSCEEQRRLEQLLVEYPVEAVESRRFAKIAKALGNRTPQQVSSRVQKYFKKLYEAGLPIPGRIPKSRRSNAKSRLQQFRPTTFFPAHNVRVQMPDDDDEDLLSIRCIRPIKREDRSSASPLLRLKAEPCTETDNDDTDTRPMSEPPGLDTEKAREQKIYLLEMIRNEKLSNVERYYPDPMSPLCEACDIRPIARIRYRCHSCACFLSLCIDCLARQVIEDEFEHAMHQVEAINEEH